MSSQYPSNLRNGWPCRVRSTVNHAISLTSAALTCAWSRAATGRSSRTRLEAEFDRANTEIALLKEELDIKDSRWNRLPPRRRNSYGCSSDS
jgi:hypothetical protein